MPAPRVAPSTGKRRCLFFGFVFFPSPCGKQHTNRRRFFSYSPSPASEPPRSLGKPREKPEAARGGAARTGTPLHPPIQARSPLPPPPQDSPSPPPDIYQINATEIHGPGGVSDRKMPRGFSIPPTPPPRPVPQRLWLLTPLPSAEGDPPSARPPAPGEAAASRPARQPSGEGRARGGRPNLGARGSGTARAGPRGRSRGAA